MREWISPVSKLIHARRRVTYQQTPGIPATVMLYEESLIQQPLHNADDTSSLTAVFVYSGLTRNA